MPSTCLRPSLDLPAVVICKCGVIAISYCVQRRPLIPTRLSVRRITARALPYRISEWCDLRVVGVGRAFSLFVRPLLWNPVYSLSANAGVYESCSGQDLTCKSSEELRSSPLVQHRHLDPDVNEIRCMKHEETNQMQRAKQLQDFKFRRSKAIKWSRASAYMTNLSYALHIRTPTSV